MYLPLSQICIRPRERPRTEESTMSRERTRMRWSDDMMSSIVDKGLLLDGRVPPEDEHDSFSFFRKQSNSCISEVLPSHPLMARWLSFTDGEDGIQEEDSLLRPVSEICLCSLDSDIRLQFSENITETRLYPRSIRNRKRESHSGTSRMIRILPEDDHFHILKRSHRKSPENIFLFWKTYLLFIFACDEFCECWPIESIEFWSKNR